MNLPAIAPRPDLYDEAERWSVDQVRSHQLDRLRWTLAHAYENVLHYRTALDRVGWSPARSVPPESALAT